MALLKKDVAVAAFIAQAAAWCAFRKPISVFFSSAFNPSKTSADTTDEEDKLATGESTDGKAKISSNSGAAQ